LELPPRSPCVYGFGSRGIDEANPHALYCHTYAGSEPTGLKTLGTSVPVDTSTDSLYGVGPDTYAATFYMIPKTHGDLGGSSNSYTSSDVPQGPGMPTGLGLLLAGWYLTQQGATVLACPSTTIDMAGIEASTEYQSNVTDFEGFKYCFQHDGEEPFYTSGGKYFMGNGDLGDNVGGEAMRNNMGVGTWVGNSNFEVAPVNLCQPDDGGSSYGQKCGIFGSYELRDSMPTEGDETVHYGSMKLDDALAGGNALASDAIHGNIPTFALYQILTVQLGGYPAWRSGYEDRMNIIEHKWTWVANHDNAYNVLFADGSVKTYSDAGMSLRKTLIAFAVPPSASRYVLPTIGQKAALVWEPYFDALYAQD